MITTIVIGLFHGLLAGNFADAGLSDVHLGEVLFSYNWGTACLIAIFLLWVSYLLRKAFKKHWMKIHRILTIGLLVIMVIHIADVGIQLPSRVFSKVVNSEDSKEKIENPINGSAAFSGAQLKDGVYEGSAQGYKSVIKVSVTVKNGAVTDVKILEENDTPNFFEWAKEIINDIINKQSLNVDAVSGATYSSVGIINAVNNALEAAVTEGELEYNDTDISPGQNKGHGDRKEKPGKRQDFSR